MQIQGGPESTQEHNINCVCVFVCLCVCVCVFVSLSLPLSLEKNTEERGPSSGDSEVLQLSSITKIFLQSKTHWVALNLSAQGDTCMETAEEKRK